MSIKSRLLPFNFKEVQGSNWGHGFPYERATTAVSPEAAGRLERWDRFHPEKLCLIRWGDRVLSASWLHLKKNMCWHFCCNQTYGQKNNNNHDRSEFQDMLILASSNCYILISLLVKKNACITCTTHTKIVYLKKKRANMANTLLGLQKWQLINAARFHLECDFVLDGMGVMLYCNMSLRRVIRLVAGRQQNIALPWWLNNDIVLTCVHFSKSSMSRHWRRPLTSGRLNWHLWSSGSWPSIPTPWCQSYRGAVGRAELWCRVASLCEENDQRTFTFWLVILCFFSCRFWEESGRADCVRPGYLDDCQHGHRLQRHGYQSTAGRGDLLRG